MSRAAERPTTVARGLLLLATVLAIASLLYSVYGQRQRDALRVGEPSPQTFVAPVGLQVEDRLATERDRQAARNQISTVFTSDAQVQQLVTNSATSAGLPAEAVDLVVNRYRNPDGVTAAEVAEIIDTAVGLTQADRQREVRLVLERRLIPTSVPNERLTEAARNAASAAVAPVMESLRAGQVIVRQDEALTADHLRVLQEVGLYSARSDAYLQTLWIVLGCLLLSSLLSLPAIYAWRALRDQLSFEQLAFLIGLTLITLTVQRLAVLVDASFVFVALVPVLVAVLVSETAGLMWAVWLGLVVALLVPAAPLFTLAAGLVGGVVAALTVLMVRSRAALLLAGIAGGLASAATFTIVAIVAGGISPLATVTAALLYLAGGGLAGIVSLGLLPLAESVFGFMTDFRLLELSSPTSPLLQKLLLEAPGTYQHSLIISNLVEQAVKNIGGNALLARVGSLYHDVGKVKRPHFFVENQFSGENPHNNISPHLSYLIITSHVRDGVEMLREYKLPRSLEAFAAEHHGTTVLAYFFKRALEDNNRLDELNFRYPGPRPRSKEAAVLMLADAIESASRTLVEPSQGSIRAMIDRIFEQRLQDGQLSESPLNFHDLEIIANTFERMLTAILHRRINYPSAEEVRSLKQGDREGGARGGSPRRDGAIPAP